MGFLPLSGSAFGDGDCSFDFEDSLCSYEAYGYSVSRTETILVFLMVSSTFYRIVRLMYYNKTLRVLKKRSL